jgi:DNA-binding response OmpR family regulator
MQRIARESGADDFLAKPFQMEDVLSLIGADFRKKGGKRRREKASLRKYQQEEDSLRRSCVVINQ